MQYVDLAPEIYRQRCVVEGYPAAPIAPEQIVEYLNRLSDLTAMHTILPPMTSHCGEYGWAGWIHWSTSGAHFYAWDRPRLFFSVDAYTCKAFDPAKVVEFTREFFGAEVITCKSF